MKASFLTKSHTEYDNTVLLCAVVLAAFHRPTTLTEKRFKNWILLLSFKFNVVVLILNAEMSIKCVYPKPFNL